MADASAANALTQNTSRSLGGFASNAKALSATTSTVLADGVAVASVTVALAPDVPMAAMQTPTADPSLWLIPFGLLASM
jgi:hypothetical protein